MEEVNPSHPFSDAGFNDVTVGSEIFNLLQVSEATFKIPGEFSKLQEVAQFFKNAPDAAFIVSKLVSKGANPNIKPLDHVWSYVSLRKSHEEAKAKVKALEEEISFYE